MPKEFESKTERMVYAIRRDRSRQGEPSKVYEAERDICVAIDRRFELMHETFKSLCSLTRSVEMLAERVTLLEEMWRDHENRLTVVEDCQREERTKLFNLMNKGDSA